MDQPSQQSDLQTRASQRPIIKVMVQLGDFLDEGEISAINRIVEELRGKGNVEEYRFDPMNGFPPNKDAYHKFIIKNKVGLYCCLDPKEACDKFMERQASAEQDCVAETWP